MVGLANWYGTSLVVSDTGTSAGNVIFVSTITCTADCSVGVFSFFSMWASFLAEQLSLSNLGAGADARHH